MIDKDEWPLFSSFNRGAVWKSPWISVKERLPESRKSVLIYDGRDITVGYVYKFSNPGNMVWHTDCETFNDPTHWMPLPEVPKDPQ